MKWLWIAALLLCVGQAEARTIEMMVVAPRTDHVGPTCPDGLVEVVGDWYEGAPLADLKEILIRAVRYDAPLDTFDYMRIPAQPAGGDTLYFQFDTGDTSGFHGELFAYAVDVGGNYLCRGMNTSVWLPAAGAPRDTTVVPPLTFNGLSAEYFNEKDLTVPGLQRIDPAVDFNWAKSSPDALIGIDTFSCRWTGYVVPLFTETYTFYTVSDDGIRLFIDGIPVVNQWNNHAVTEHSGLIPLVAGARYAIVLEHYESAYDAVARLLWSSASQAKQVVPPGVLSH